MKSASLSGGTKNLLELLGLLLFLSGTLAALAFGCASLYLLGIRSPDSGLMLTLPLFSLTLLTLGGGFVFLRHSAHSHHGRPSTPFTLPSFFELCVWFAIFLLVGIFITVTRFLPVLILPVLLSILAVLPPLAAVSWFMMRRPEGLTWRRATVAFVSGAMFSTSLAIFLELILPFIALNLISGIATAVGRAMQTFFDALGGGRITSALTSPAFVLLFVQLAIFAPLIEELCKPLVTLPLLRYLPRREAFLVGALAGAGFAALENIIYLGSGYSVWAGIMLVRALGGAIHPLGAGLVATGWHAVLNREPNAKSIWLVRFATASGMHALWNGGSLAIITLTGIPFFGRTTPQLDVLGLSATGLVLSFLLVVGLAALWLGHVSANGLLWTTGPTVGADGRPPQGRPPLPTDNRAPLPPDRAIAIWAVVCLVVVLPLGIVVLRIFGR